MTFPSGALSQHFQANESPAKADSSALRTELVVATRHLVEPCLANTEFCRGVLSASFVRSVPTHTIFSRRDRGNVPYLLADLVKDLREGTVSRLTIDETTENAIRSLARDVSAIPVSPLPVIIEASSAQNYLILEGNKRFGAIALADSNSQSLRLDAYIGRSTLRWPELLANYGMRSAA